MNVSEWMTTETRTVKLGSGIVQALELMLAEDLGHLPVIDQERLVGLVSKSALMRFMPSEATTLSRWEMPELLKGITVARAVDHPPVSVTPQHTLKEAARTMQQEGLDVLPVVVGGKVVGMITNTALLEALQVALS